MCWLLWHVYVSITYVVLVSIAYVFVSITCVGEYIMCVVEYNMCW